MEGYTQSGYPPNTGFYYENIDFSKLQKQGRRYLPLPHPPIELCGGACFACFIAHVFGPCMVLHETVQHERV